MPSPRSITPLIIPGAVLLAALGACSTQLAARTPRGVDLSGEWQLDMSLSDYPQAAVPAGTTAANGSDTSGTGTGGTGGGGTGGGGTGGGGRGHGGRGRRGAGSGSGPGGTAGSPERRFAMPPHLRLTQSGTTLVVHITMPDGKTATNAYRAGDKSVVTTNQGAANRTTGWRHKAFVIVTQLGDKGPKSEVQYFIDDDHMLEVISTISNAGSYNFQYTLVYDRATG